ncbi:STAS domain-containing protein [Actinoplanes sp. NPDC048796]|uniref:STAS domain-containing protein n=1 Tax=Actinoplanes sp. NPDC048796 TaxID=3155640 RepID=UPI0033DA030D
MLLDEAPATLSDADGYTRVAVSRRVDDVPHSGEATDVLSVITVDGDLDIDTAPLLLAVLVQELRTGDVCCDLTHVPFLAAAGTHALLAAHNYAIGQGRSFWYRGAHGITAQVMAIADPDEVVPRRP